ncbi:MAG: tyrosine-type recombinase/integrase [Methylococcales bacterium]
MPAGKQASSATDGKLETIHGTWIPAICLGEPGKDGNRRAYTINKVWEIALKRAKITGLRFHNLRHEAVSRLVEKGLSDQEVSAVSGQKSMQNVEAVHSFEGGG